MSKSAICKRCAKLKQADTQKNIFTITIWDVFQKYYRLFFVNSNLKLIISAKIRHHLLYFHNNIALKTPNSKQKLRYRGNYSLDKQEESWTVSLFEIRNLNLADAIFYVYFAESMWVPPTQLNPSLFQVVNILNLLPSRHYVTVTVLLLQREPGVLTSIYKVVITSC